MSFLRHTLDLFRSGGSFGESNAEALLDAMITEQDEGLLADVFHAWNEKGIDEDEIYSLAKIMRERCARVNSRHETFVDIVGTGGSRSKTFNVSTAAAFVIAGEGIPVAKHGNKAATSNTGSADVLSALGIEPAVDLATAERCLNDIGICFMFAPNFHRLSPTLGKVRRALGFPTIFNCVGPLCNPANAPHQLIGVWSQEMVPKIANALARLGTKRSWVVHGKDGLDEISLAGKTFVSEVNGDSVNEFDISPRDFGVDAQNHDGLEATTPKISAAIINEILKADKTNEAAESIVLLNAAAPIFLTGNAVDLRTAFESARDSLMSGRAKEKIRALAMATK